MALNTLLDSMRLCIADSRTARIFLVLGCPGGDERAWQRPYLGEVAHYKAGPCLNPSRLCYAMQDQSMHMPGSSPAWGRSPTASRITCGPAALLR